MFNITVLALMAYCLSIPLIASGVTELWPALTVCRHYARTGEPCVFCGLTRDAGAFMATGRLPVPPHNPRAAPLLAVFAISGLFRIWTVLPFRWRGLHSRLLADASLHCALGAFLALNWGPAP